MSAALKWCCVVEAAVHDLWVQDFAVIFSSSLSPSNIFSLCPPFHFLSVHIRGANIIAETKLEVIPGKRLTYEWKGYGLKLSIPPNALETGTSTLTMTIQASLNGHFQFPDGTELISGVYWVAFPQKFSQPVTIELQHCANLKHRDQVSSLVFLTAKCNQKTLPYEFQPLAGGTFSIDSSYGSIKLSHFSAVAVGLQEGKEKKEEQDELKRYVAKVFYIPQTSTTWHMHFTIFCDLELSNKVCMCYTCALSLNVH